MAIIFAMTASNNKTGNYEGKDLISVSLNKQSHGLVILVTDKPTMQP